MTQPIDPFSPPVAKPVDNPLEAGVEFADNPEPRCPCVLLLDTSGSMRGEPITALNDGLRSFKSELVQDSLASRRVEVAIVTFGGDVKVVQDFITADEFTPPTLEASGLTPMGTAIQKSLEILEARKAQYKANGVAYYRPWVFLITDGSPEGESEQAIADAVRRIQADEAAKRVAFFSVGVQNADMNQLKAISPRPPLKLQGLHFVELFVWLSRSTQQVANSKVGDQVALPPVNWGTV
jgi:uncharacterized protein YegL